MSVYWRVSLSLRHRLKHSRLLQRINSTLVIGVMVIVSIITIRKDAQSFEALKDPQVHRAIPVIRVLWGHKGL